MSKEREADGQGRFKDNLLSLYARIYYQSQEAIMITDCDARIIQVNPSFTAITGYLESEVVGCKPSLLKSHYQSQTFYTDMWASIRQEGKWRGEIWNRRKNGEAYPEWLSITSLRDEEGRITHYIGMFSDITERKRSEERLRYLAHHDKLTGLPNRMLLYELLEEATQGMKDTDRTLAVLFVDLDLFKQVNDSLGHAAGDLLLQQVAGRMRSALQPQDIVSRLGGDEFIIVLQNLGSPEDAVRAASQLYERIKAPYRIENHALLIRASIGISLYPTHAEDCETLVKYADQAMYEAKQGGGYSLFRARNVTL